MYLKSDGKSALCNFIIEDSKLAMRMSEQVKYIHVQSKGPQSNSLYVRPNLVS